MTGLALFVFGLLIALSASFGIRGEDDADIIRSLAKEPLERMILRRAKALYVERKHSNECHRPFIGERGRACPSSG